MVYFEKSKVDIVLFYKRYGWSNIETMVEDKV